MPRKSHSAALCAAILVGSLLLVPPAEAQETSPLEDDRLRIGFTLGGTGFVGVAFELIRGDWSGELTLATLGFRDLSVSLAGKHYTSSGKLRPVVGAGFWNLTVWSEEGTGTAFLFRVPLAVEWAMTESHAMGVEVGLNRALWIRRVDPDDDRPPRSSLVPFPGLYYRYSWLR